MAVQVESFVRTAVVDTLKKETIGKKVRVCGWVRTRRDSKGGFSFIEINDGSTFDSVQVLAEKTLPNYEDEILKLGIGSSVEVIGNVVESPGKEQTTEVKAESVKVLGFADPATYPLQKKGTSFEFLRTIAHLRPRTNTFGAVARVRNEICRSIHNFFQSRGFMYVHAPIITGSDCEGAGQMFKVTTFDLDNIPRTEGGAIDYAEDFFGKQTNLTVSGQLEGEIFATALTNIYTFGPTFRAENSNTSRHLSEFWMIEPEMSFCDLEGNMDCAEAFLKTIFSDVLTNCGRDMAFFNERIDKTVIETLRGIVESDFARVSYTEAVDILLKSGESFEFPVQWGIDLQSEHERYLSEKKFKKPVVVYDYPKDIKAFYMRANEDGKTVRAMDVLVPKVGEIIGGSQREERYDVLVQRMKDSHLNPEDYWWYLDLRRYGTVPHSGFGLGLERTVQFCTGMTNIRDVIPFPRAPKTAEF
ncbi:MAG: asparagine--tRNA ligase [Candidatus Obscuribacter sp.]|jgi:asparaginyl-tRNA synthetase|nr:asparagine--tRNA ligase [Candidatus Obscuribacter sp.]MDQ5966050.1 asparaginyl-tRNA synthetase [Cyanobacteriota bacterium erpe_2018_sw_39hr_WHONDRS-SW48-000098_B_bin.30]MBK9201826.1 asparagine--tRNA ligase [Candidatus Obscuribacter sp.]MBK9620116.1 asparagine--tRNA ligase [Candidatus Obscuribacter sp.]MBK9774245.1 asparagine--tRNA ligase [Candidatus Obscuribacter sp.]